MPEEERFAAESCEIRSGDLPCGGCRHCQRADLWSAFTEDVDDAVPFALPTVCEVVRDIGVCTDVSTEGGNGETGGVFDGEATTKEDNSDKPDPESQGECPTLENLFLNACRVDVLTVDGDFRLCACAPEPEVDVPVGPIVLQPSSWGFTCADLIEAQGQDQDLGFALQGLIKEVKPGEAELFAASPGAKVYWLNKEQLSLTDGVL